MSRHPRIRIAAATVVAALSLPTGLVVAGPIDPCATWETVAAPNPGLFRNGFLDAAVGGSGPLFALHRSTDTDGAAAPPTYRLLRRGIDGWTDLGQPGTEGLPDGAAWTCLAVAPDGDVFVGGRAIWEPGTLALPTIVRWDSASQTWAAPVGVALAPQVVEPNADRGGAVEAIAVAPDGTLIAVGTATGFGNGLDTSVPLFLVNDGTGWIEIADPDFNWPGGGVGAGISLFDVVASSATDVWAVGRHAAGEGLTSGGLVVHWDGATLELVEDPRTGGIFLGRDLGGIAVTGAPGLIAVGDGTALGGPTVTLAHFDGVDWSLAASPFDGIGALEQVVVAPDGTAWATGVFAGEAAWFDGTVWTRRPFATADDVRVQGMAADGDGVLWTLGDTGAIDAHAQHLVCGGNACPADLDGDGLVGIEDLIGLLAAWGTTSPTADLDGDGVVGIGDLLGLLAAWGPCT